MPRPQKKPPRKEATPVILVAGQKWRDTKFREGTRIAEILSVEDRMVMVKLTVTVGNTPSVRGERLPASMFGQGSTWALVT